MAVSGQDLLAASFLSVIQCAYIYSVEKCKNIIFIQSKNAKVYRNFGSILI